jgi:arsenate reductase
VIEIVIKEQKIKIEIEMKILILCTGNSCRSQMAHGFLQSFDESLQVYSAGTEASGKLNLKALEVMGKAEIDISKHTSDQVEKYIEEEWDYVITVCGGANENCPAFFGKVKHRLHIGFDDPSHAVGTPEFIEGEYYRVRDEIRAGFWKLYNEEIKQQL